MGFPSSPADEQIYTNANGTRYQYDATDNKWIVIGGAYNINTLTVATLQVTDQMTGVRGNFTTDITGVRGNFTNSITGARGNFTTDVTGVRGTFTHLTGTSGVIDNLIISNEPTTENQAARRRSLELGIAGTTGVHTNAAEVDLGTATSYVKAKEIICYTNVSGCTIYWQMTTENVGYTAYSKLYLNGVAVGPEKTTNSLSWIDETTNLTGLHYGDQIQIYAHGSDGGGFYSCKIKNMQIRYDEFVDNDP